WPLLPKDFNPLHNQAAPPDQRSAEVVGGEEVTLVNLTPDGVWTFRLPRLDVPVRLIDAVGRGATAAEVSPRLDTVILEPDARRVLMSARLAIPVDRHRPPLREVVLGHVTGGWLRSRLTGKKFL